MPAKIPNKRILQRISLLALTGAWMAPFLPTASAELPERIVWYGVLEDGLEEAIVTGKPVLLTSAAPRCMEVPGKW